LRQLVELIVGRRELERVVQRQHVRRQRRHRHFTYGVAPQSLDPGMDYTTEGAEVNWITYTGLTTYAHANGSPGRS